MPNITLRLPATVHGQLMAQCQAQGITATAAVRSWIESKLSGAPAISLQAPAIAPVSVVDTSRNSGRLVSSTIKLTESEHEQIRLRKQLHGCTKTAWMVRTIRAALTCAPVLDEEQTEAVKESNYQLLAIGKNINQIARRLNEGQDKQAKALELEQLKTIRADIKAHTGKVIGLMDTVTGRGHLS